MFYFRKYDTWLLLSFSILFILIHIGFFVWYYNAYRSITNIIRDEKKFINNLNEKKQNQNIKNNKKNVDLTV